MQTQLVMLVLPSAEFELLGQEVQPSADPTELLYVSAGHKVHAIDAKTFFNS